MRTCTSSRIGYSEVARLLVKLSAVGFCGCIPSFPSSSGSDASSPDAKADVTIVEAGLRDTAAKDATGAKEGGRDAVSDAPAKEAGPKDGATDSEAGSCTNLCTAGVAQCADGEPVTCVTQANGCTGLMTTATCGTHQTCSIAGGGGTSTCVCTPTICTEMGTLCESSATVATCAIDTDGCPYVASTSPCTSPKSCSGVAPNAGCSLTCSDSCAQGQTACISGGLATCTLGSNGCYAYGTPLACPSAYQTCTGTSGSAACTCTTNPVCSAAGNTCASSSIYASCAKDAEGCFYEASSATCGSGAPFCDGAGQCGTCLNGTTQCLFNGVETCTGGAWGTAVSCPSSTPNCNAGVCGQPASCQTSAPGTTTCGASGTGSCCASPEVPGGEFYLTYTNSGTGATGAVDLATLHGFRLDAYNVTVGRFRQFVAAWNVGYNPPEGSGIHAHLNGGLGLVNSAVTTPVTYETGWDATDWNSLVTPTNDNLFDGTTPYVGASWTASQGGNEMLPIDYVSWYEAYAFCIWDGGFLPSEAEWQFAAAGGGGANGQLEYPWGSTPPGMTNQYAIFGVQPGEADPECYYPGPLATCSAELAGGGAANIAPVGYASLGIGAYGQFDLLGSVLEWTLDWDAPYTIPCTDCSYLTEPSSAERVMRSSTFLGPLASPWTRTPVAPAQTQVGFGEGFRCARSP